ncbi:type IV toxin-antitoxin system AbiEi family antitoxin [Aeromicrobium sp. UC242_57]|uniref:type IV toxin-antitoxin system AbiEi family antitoxin domain-containing protein n=1 Tax=Aeromicrobium sp. UC242_57 TaxID=3374624 RepID=UPI0037BEF40A
MELTQAPLRTVRPKDLADRYVNPRAALARMATQGAVVRLAHGYFVATPDDQSAHWKPTMEAAAAGIASAIFGQRDIVLMGITAARIHHAIPRALGSAVVASPRQHRPVALDGGGRVIFVARDTIALDARLEALETGRALVTTPEQTLLDLAKRPDLGGARDEALSALSNLASRVTWDKVDRLVDEQHFGKTTLARVAALR